MTAGNVIPFRIRRAPADPEPPWNFSIAIFGRGAVGMVTDFDHDDGFQSVSERLSAFADMLDAAASSLRADALALEAE